LRPTILHWNLDVIYLAIGNFGARKIAVEKDFAMLQKAYGNAAQLLVLDQISQLSVIIFFCTDLFLLWSNLFFYPVYISRTKKCRVWSPQYDAQRYHTNCRRATSFCIFQNF
jgi:hypothetical protein